MNAPSVEIKDYDGPGRCQICFGPHVTPPDLLRAQLGIMTDVELAGALEVSTNTLATWRGKKTGPKSTSLGKSVFYKYDDIREWINTS